MLTRQSNVQKENALSLNLLNSAAKSDYVKNILQELSEPLITRIIEPLQQAVSEVKQYHELSKPHQNAIKKLAEHHSNKERQYARQFYHLSYHEMIEDLRHVDHLLAQFKETLQSVTTHVKTRDDIAKVIKIIVDLGFIYVEFLEKEDEKLFSALKNQLFSSDVENAARVMHTEFDDSQDLWAVTHGVSTGSDDFIKKSEDRDGIGMGSGKSVFKCVDTEKRFLLIAEAYDKARKQDPDSDKLLDFLQSYKIPTTKKTIADTYGDAVFDALLVELNKEPNQRQLKRLANRYAPQGEKLANAEQVPTVATFSGSTARPIITLFLMKGFESEGKYDLDKLQVLANCIAGLFVYAGHHSYSETAEAYNKALDYMLIDGMENNKLSSDIIAKMNAAKEAGLFAEEQLGRYYRYGNYPSFLHAHYRDDVISAKALHQTGLFVQKIQASVGQVNAESIKQMANGYC